MPALKAVIAKLDEVDEKYRDLYTQRGDKFEFTGVEGVKTQADIDRVTAALNNERTAHKTTKDAFKVATDKLGAFEDLDPEDIKAKLEKLTTLEAGTSVPELAKNFETTVNARVQTLLGEKLKAETTKLNRTITELQGKVTELSQTNETYVVQNNTRTVHDAVRSVALASKVTAEAVPDLLVIAGSELKLVDGKVQTEDGRDPAAWLEDRKAKTPYYWPVAKGTGARGGDGDSLPGGGENPFRRESYNVTKGSQLVASNPALAAKLAEQAGVPKNAEGVFQWHVMPPAPAK